MILTPHPPTPVSHLLAPPKLQAAFQALRRSDGTIALLACRIPDLGLYRLPIHLDASGGKLHPNGAFALQVEFIPCETGQEVTLPHAGVSDQHHCQGRKRQHSISIHSFITWKCEEGRKEGREGKRHHWQIAHKRTVWLRGSIQTVVDCPAFLLPPITFNG